MSGCVLSTGISHGLDLWAESLVMLEIGQLSLHVAVHRRHRCRIAVVKAFEIRRKRDVEIAGTSLPNQTVVPRAKSAEAHEQQ
jgi:hypothetical protein